MDAIIKQPMTLATIKRMDPNAGSEDAFLWAMWLMFCRAPKKAEPDSDGVYDLLEIGEVRDKTWAKATPYSLAQRIPG